MGYFLIPILGLWFFLVKPLLVVTGNNLNWLKHEGRVVIRIQGISANPKGWIRVQEPRQEPSNLLLCPRPLASHLLLSLSLSVSLPPPQIPHPQLPCLDWQTGSSIALSITCMHRTEPKRDFWASTLHLLVVLVSTSLCQSGCLRETEQDWPGCKRSFFESKALTARFPFSHIFVHSLPSSSFIFYLLRSVSCFCPFQNTGQEFPQKQLISFKAAIGA